MAYLYYCMKAKIGSVHFNQVTSVVSHLFAVYQPCIYSRSATYLRVYYHKIVMDIDCYKIKSCCILLAPHDGNQNHHTTDVFLKCTGLLLDQVAY
jgi:hypothetical protein